MMQLTGIEKIDDQLEVLEEKTGKKIARAAINAGLQVMVVEIRKRAPKHKGVLKKSIGKRFKKKKRSDLMEAVAGINVAKKKKNKEKWAHHGHLVALGTKQRKSPKGANRGKMPRNSFVPPAVSASLGTVESKMIDKARQALDREFLK